MELKDKIQPIELRSEKVRKIIDTVPSFWVRWGTSIIAMIITVLFVATMLLPYPYGQGETIFEHLFNQQ